MVSIPQPSSIDRDQLEEEVETATDGRSRFHSHRASIATVRRGTILVLREALSRFHSHRASIATTIVRSPSTPPARSRFHSHRASIATCFQDRERAYGVCCLDSTAIEHRSRRLLGRVDSRVRVGLDSTAIEHRSRPQRRHEEDGEERVSIPQPSSIDRDVHGAALSARTEKQSRFHSHRASIATCGTSFPTRRTSKSRFHSHRASIATSRTRCAPKGCKVGLDSTAIEHRSRLLARVGFAAWKRSLDSTAI